MKRLLYYSQLDTKGSVALLFLRLVAGTAFLFHGWSKIQAPFDWLGAESGMPALFQCLAAVSEFGGGIAWLLGLLTPIASVGMAGTMTVAAYFHLSHGDPFVGRGASYEAALGYLAVSFVLLLVGPGKFSMDAIFFGSKVKD